MKTMDKFIGVCGTLRNLPRGESSWKRMIALKQPISREAFGMMVSDEEFASRWGSSLDEANAQDATAGYYLSRWGVRLCVFYQNAGWEYIWRAT